MVSGDPAEAVRLMEEERPELVAAGPGASGDRRNRADEGHPGCGGGAGHLPVRLRAGGGRRQGLRDGAVDSKVKSFSPTELFARIKAALRRRATAEPPEPNVRGDPTTDYAQHRVTLAGRRVELTPTEYGMLPEPSAHPGRVLTHEHLFERVWREKGDGNVRPMRTIVSKLRRTLGDDAGNPTYIFTEPRVGLRMPRGEMHGEEPPATP